MQILRSEYVRLTHKLAELDAQLQVKAMAAVEAGEQSTENFMHDDAPQQIAVEEGRVIQRLRDDLFNILDEAEIVDSPASIKTAQIGHRVTYQLNGKKCEVDLVGFTEAADSVPQTSPNAPLGSVLIGKKPGAEFVFMNKPLKVIDIRLTPIN